MAPDDNDRPPNPEAAATKLRRLASAWKRLSLLGAPDSVEPPSAPKDQGQPQAKEENGAS